ncbi:MAG: YccF domain-containing protein [Caldilineaceae bacterium]
MSPNSGNNANVIVNVNAPPVVIVRSQPGCLVQLIYFVFIGWWLGAFAVNLAYLLFVTVLGIPLGVMIVNKLPYLMALRRTEPAVSYAGTQTHQVNFFVRAIWFVFVGWWLTLIWLNIAYLLCVIIVGMPIGFMMFDKAPGLLTLHRN